MKKPLFLIFSIGLFLFSWRMYDQGQQELQHSPPQSSLPTKVKKTNRTSQRTAKAPSAKRIKAKKRTIPKKKEIIESKEFNEKKMAIGDEKGNLYPTNLNVDGDNIIAFGDLIVGRAKDIEAIKNGEKIVSLPYPKLWPGGVVPIVVSSSVKNSRQFQWINEIRDELRKNTGINIKIFEAQKDKVPVSIERGNEHCYAQVGYTGKAAKMSLSESCSKVAIYHEFFHILGFYHEQNRFDRESYLDILWENIDEQYWPQFKLFPENSFQRVFTSGGPFEFTFNSIMLYDSNFFSLNEDYSMVRKDGTPFYSQFSEPTEIDLARLKELYARELNK